MMRLVVIVTWLLCLLLQPLSYGQMGGFEGMMGDPFAAADRPAAKFVILLGPDLKPGQKPFLDPYEMAQQQVGNIHVPVESISVDLTTPLPTRPGVSVQVKHPRVLPPGEDLDDLKGRIRREAIRFGITDVELSEAEGEERVSVRVRVGLPAGQPHQVDLRKYAHAAAVLDPQSPTVELFDERPLHAAGDGMLPGMGMETGGLGGLMMGGEGFGSGGYDPMAQAHAPRQAPAEGTVQGGSLVVSWSIEKGYASAIGTQTGTGWIRIELEGKRMTTPVVADAVCAFYCDGNAYAFSANLGRWDVLKIPSLPEPPPAIVVDAHTATIRTADDLHIFTSASGRWSSRSQSERPSPLDLRQPAQAGSSRTVENAPGNPFAPVTAMPSPFGPSFPMQLFPSTAPPTGFGSHPAVDDLTVGDLTTQAQNLRTAKERAEAETARLADQFKQAADETQKAEIKTQLAAAAAAEFQVSTDLQTMEARLLAKKFGLLEEQFRRRERHRDALIQQRIDKLLAK